MPGGVGVTPAVASTASGITLLRYRQRLAKTLGSFAVGSVSTQAASFEAERTLIAATLRSDWPKPTHFDGLFCYFTSGIAGVLGQQRRLLDGTFDGPLGALVLDEPLDAAVAVGSAFELSVLPATPYFGSSGLNEIIDEGLDTLPLVDYVPITVTATGGVTDTQYSLDGYPWPIKAIAAVIYPRTSTTSEIRREMPQVWDFDQDGETRVLSFSSLPARVGDVVEVRLTRPARTRVKHGGVWTDTADGLVDDADEGTYDIPTVVAVSRPIALARLALGHPRGSQERAALLGESEAEYDRAALARWYGGFRGSGRQRIGAGGSSRAWSKGWP